MSNIKWTEKRIDDCQSKGLGTGSGANYMPWIDAHAFSSQGRTRRVWSDKTGRVHHLFSNVEYDIFVASEWSRTVIDIWEQYPLERDITQTIAQKLKIRHPHYVGTQVPTVMTVDFLLTVAGPGGESFVAVNAKRDEEAEDSTSLEKLEIQRTYFEDMRVPHHLIYHSQLPAQKIKNIKWVRDAQLKQGEVEPRQGLYASLKGSMGREIAASRDDSTTLDRYCSSFDERYGLEPGTGLRVARMLMHERALMVNLESPDLAREPLETFLMTSRAGQLRAIGGV